MQTSLMLRRIPRPKLAESPDVAGAYQEYVALANDKPLRLLRRLEVIAEDVLAWLKPRYAAQARDIEQDASTDQTVFQDVNRVDRCSIGRHGIDLLRIIQKPPIVHVAERI